MTTKTLQVITCAAVLALGPLKLAAQQSPVAPKTRRLGQASEYLKVATYFHHRELAFRAKAQVILNDYSRDSVRYPMATKTITHATAVALRYYEYQVKANENARLAASYEDKLRAMGFELPNAPRVTVSLKELQTDPSAIGN